MASFKLFCERLPCVSIAVHRLLNAVWNLHAPLLSHLNHVYSATGVQKSECESHLELDPVRRPWNKAQAIFLGVMRDHAKLPRETFDIRSVDSGLRV